MGAAHSATTVILGRTGFLGGAVYEFLARKGLKILAPSSAECNLLDGQKVTSYFSKILGPWQIIFCAGITRSREDSFEAMLKNVQMIHHLTRLASSGRVAGVVYLGSTDVYGRAPNLPITEQNAVEPAGPYGIGKFCGESLLRSASQERFPLAILRLPGVYGPGDHCRSVIGRFYEQIATGGRVTIFGDGSVRRDYVEVSDVCGAVCNLLGTGWDGVLNLATGFSVAIRDLVGLIAQALGVAARVEYLPSSGAEAAGDLVFDVSKLQSVLPGLQLKALQEGIARYIYEEKVQQRKVNHG